MDNTKLDYYENRKQKEKIILLTLTCYSIGMAAVSFILSWSWYVPVVIVAGLLGAWSLCVLRIKDYRFRINVLAIISLIDFMMYGVRAGSLYDLLTPTAAVAVLLGIAALPEVLYWVDLTTIFLCLYHIFVLHTVPLETPLDKCRAVLILISIGLVEGITYLLMKNQQRILKQMQDIISDLKFAESSKSDFMANMSHEIRTPINAVCGISEIMLQEQLSPKLREDVHDIQMAGRTLQRIISDLLDFIELLSGQFSLAEDSYNLTSTINDVINITQAQIESKKIEFIIDCDTKIPCSLVGDEQKIRRVMLNILNNAVKFTDEGCIFISIGYRVESYGINLIVGIKDTGIGIKKEHLEKIFMNFNQVDTKKNRKEGGLGLGLAISKALIQKMGGFIKIESEWKKGTEVQFVIPQKVLNRKPMLEVNDCQSKRVISCLNIEKYQYALAREGYFKVISHVVEQFQLDYQACRNLGELKRRLERENYTHLFIGWKEYNEDIKFFEEKARELSIILVMDRKVYGKNIEVMQQNQVMYLFKPFYALSIATALSGTKQSIQVNDNIYRVRFEAPGASVLVVDDSLMNLKVVEGLLRPYQIQVFTAESGAEALEKIERCDFDFIFMDHMMPEMDGVETLHKIRNKPGNYFQNVPVIALTANAVGGAREMFLQEGFQDFVSKPIELSGLERVLRKYIPEYKKKKAVDSTLVKNGIEIQREKIDEIEEIPGLDMRLGIQYAGGNLEDYWDIVKIYCSTGKKNSSKIRNYYEKQDWKNYTILVHAIKSTSLGIGAKELSEMAKALEEAGKMENANYIKNHHEPMIEYYDRMIGVLEEKLSYILKAVEESDVIQDDSQELDKKQLKELTTEEFENLILELSNALESFNDDNVKPVIHKMENYQYKNRDLKKIAESLEKKIAEFDFLCAKADVDQLREEIDKEYGKA